jgi:hypothetical protein
MSMNPTRLRVEGRLPSRDYLVNHARQGKNQEIEAKIPQFPASKAFILRNLTAFIVRDFYFKKSLKALGISVSVALGSSNSTPDS